MSKVLITRSKLDGLATTIAAKSGATLPLTIAQMDAAVQGIETGGLDLPTFSATIDEETGGLTNIICDKTFEECYELANDNDLSAAILQVVTNGITIPICLHSVSESMLRYGVISTNVFIGDIVMRSNGTCEYVTPSSTAMTLTVTENGTYADEYGGAYNEVTVNVPSSAPTLQSKSVSYTPSETAQSATVTADSGYDGLSSVAVSVEAISSTYVGSGVPVISSEDIVFIGTSHDGKVVEVPSGVAYDNLVVGIPQGSATTPNTTITANPSITVNNAGLITSTTSASQTVEPITSEGWVYDDYGGEAGTITVSGSSTSQLDTQAAKTVTPTEETQTAVAAGKYTTGAVTVGAIPSDYVGSGVTQRSSTDLTASGVTVTVPAGYYSTQASKAVASGSAGTPTATKDTVSNHSVSVTPSVTNTTGYITGGTKTGTAITVSASELVSGTLSITSSGTTDVTNYASASVAAGGATASATKGTVSNHSVTVTPSVTRTAGYVAAGSSNGTAVTVSASELVSGTYTVSASGTHDVTNYASASVAAGGATASATKGTVSNHSVTVTPSVTRTAGYVTAGTANGTAVTVSASELVSGSQTITDNGTVDVTNLASVVVNIAGGGAAYRRVEVCPQQTVTPDSNRKVTPTGMSELNVGDDYIVTLDGTEYFTTCCLLWETNHVIGDTNCIFSPSGDLTYPFVAVTVTGVKEIYFSDTTQHTIKIERLELLTDPVTYVTYHTSSSEPTSAQGDNGDIWLVTS